MRNSPLSRFALAVMLATGLMAVAPRQTSAHDIPQSVAILAYIKPEGNTLRVVARLPLEALRDVEWPLRDPAYLIIGRATPLLRDAIKVWVAQELRIFEENVRLDSARIAAARIELPSNRAFEHYESAVANAHAPPLSDSVDLPRQQAMVDIVLEYAITSPTSHFSIDPRLAHLGVRTSTVLHFIPSDGNERVLRYTGNPGVVRLDPRWWQAASQFIALGFKHILGGIDHLLFVLCLVIPVRRLRTLIGIVTSFTVAHSITLIGSAAGFAPDALWFPPLIEVLIAASIVWMALENIVGAKTERRWIIAFAFGLVHGFGFSFALRESLQFAGTHLVTSLFAFNIGVEIGQIAVLLVAIPVLGFLYRRVRERMAVIILSAIVAHTAWHWMLDRGALLVQYRIALPALDAAFAVTLMRLLMFVLAAGGALWFLRAVLGRGREKERAAATTTTTESAAIER